MPNKERNIYNYRNFIRVNAVIETAGVCNNSYVEQEILKTVHGIGKMLFSCGWPVSFQDCSRNEV